MVFFANFKNENGPKTKTACRVIRQAVFALYVLLTTSMASYFTRERNDSDATTNCCFELLQS
jgi:hypothetical protein